MSILYRGDFALSMRPLFLEVSEAIKGQRVRKGRGEIEATAFLRMKMGKDIE